MTTASELSPNSNSNVWEPMPRDKCPRLATAGSIFSGVSMLLLLFGGLILSVFLCTKVLGRPAPLLRDPVWWVLAAVMSLGPPIFFEWKLYQRHRSKRLSINAEEVRFGGSSVQLADLKSISTGQFQGFMERNFSTLEKAAVIASNPITASAKIEGAKAGRQQLRDYSLTLTKHDGKQVHWIGALAYFKEEDLKAFFHALLERKPELELQAKPSETSST
ncbi:hypothetical protein [Blastopirellula retiformator]|uniref:Uncharacterized protein n=1 Tax=Blastopirellula retiformator TaxID=2527970 RepID=A0A5C5V2M4_9BACT|nr:hypothetical protein [Blastopirellula retiformator]TWT31972.1 hypothetical protein Enr8_38980 [Blastopirellula retiformator]